MKLETQKCFYDIIAAGRAIKSFTNELSSEDFQSDAMAQAAVERKFEIIGEALSRIRCSEPEVLRSISHVERVIGFRNVIAHGYDAVDCTIVWEAVVAYLPRLLAEIESSLGRE